MTHENSLRDGVSAPAVADLDWGRPARAVEAAITAIEALSNGVGRLPGDHGSVRELLRRCRGELASAGGTFARAKALNRGIDAGS